MEEYECAHQGEVLCHWENIFRGVALMGYAEQVPRVPAVIRLNDGVHILSEVIETSPQDVYDGMPVRMVLRKQKRESNSNWMYGFKFVPIRRAEQ